MNQPGSCSRRGYEIYVGNPFGLPVALVIGKEKRSGSLKIGSADRSAKLVALEMALSR